MKTWKVFLHFNRTLKDDKGERQYPSDAQQETLLSRKGLETAADVKTFVVKHWPHLVYERAEDVTPEPPKPKAPPTEKRGER